MSLQVKKREKNAQRRQQMLPQCTMENKNDREKNTNDIKYFFSEESPTSTLNVEEGRSGTKICTTRIENVSSGGLFVKLINTNNLLMLLPNKLTHGLNNFKAAYTKTAVGIEACLILDQVQPMMLIRVSLIKTA